MMFKKLAVGLIILVGLVLVLQRQADEIKEQFVREKRQPFIPPKPQVVKAAALGYHTVLADFYWLGAIQYTVDAMNAKVPFDDLYPLADFITDLDPRFCMAYYYAGLHLSVHQVDLENTATLLEKGKTNCPDYWRIFFMLGYHYYFNLGENIKAAENLELVDEIRGFGMYGRLAARLRADAGNPEDGVVFLNRLLEMVDDERTRANIQDELQRLETSILEKKLTEAAENYFRKHDRKPARLEDLVAGGILDRLPGHPLPGHRFVYDPERNEVKSDPPVFTGVYR